MRRALLRLPVLLTLATPLICIDALTGMTGSEHLTSNTGAFDQRLLRTYTSVSTTDANERDDKATKSDDTEERAINAATIEKFNEGLEAAALRLAFAHWFEGGKTTADVRLIMSLPATGDAVGYANWPKYLKYLDFVEQKRVEAANAAKVAALKWKRVYRDWYYDNKSFTYVRAHLGLPAEGDAVDHANWQIFQNYLAYFKAESSKY